MGGKGQSGCGGGSGHSDASGLAGEAAAPLGPSH